MSNPDTNAKTLEEQIAELETTRIILNRLKWERADWEDDDAVDALSWAEKQAEEQLAALHRQQQEGGAR